MYFKCRATKIIIFLILNTKNVCQCKFYNLAE